MIGFTLSVFKMADEYHNVWFHIKFFHQRRLSSFNKFNSRFDNTVRFKKNNWNNPVVIDIIQKEVREWIINIVRFN